MSENTALPTAETDPRRLAKFLYWQGWQISAVADYLKLKRSTVESWKQRDGWDSAPVLEKVEAALDARLVQLIAKDGKSGGDFKEIDLLM
ncbi:oxidoreductase, partial [Glaciimonas sp. CA11.2]|nr:oxidoreductase [Glaciimonas sp. CA11.2]